MPGGNDAVHSIMTLGWMGLHYHLPLDHANQAHPPWWCEIAIFALFFEFWFGFRPMLSLGASTWPTRSATIQRIHAGLLMFGANRKPPKDHR